MKKRLTRHVHRWSPADDRQAKDQGSIEAVIEAKRPADDGQAKGQVSIEAVFDKFSKRFDWILERHLKV